MKTESTWSFIRFSGFLHYLYGVHAVLTHLSVFIRWTIYLLPINRFCINEDGLKTNAPLGVFDEKTYDNDYDPITREYTVEEYSN